MRSFKPFVIVAVLVGLCAAAPLAHAAKPSSGPAEKVRVFKTVAAPYDHSYAEWSAKWWQWALAIPLINPDTGARNHPLFDGTDCSVGQSGHVWFLGGRFCETGKACPAAGTEVRSCTVPKGTALFIPIVNGEDSLLEEAELGGSNLTIEAMRSFVSGIFDTVKDLQLSVDGVPVENLKEDFRVQSPVFDFTLPAPVRNNQANNVFTAIEWGYYPAGTYYSQAVGDGYYVMLKPLPPGVHTVSFSGAIPSDQGDFLISMSYVITVQ